MSLRLLARGIFAAGAATLAIFTYSSFPNSPPTLHPHAPSPKLYGYAQPDWNCGSGCSRILQTSLPEQSATPNPAFTNQTEATNEPLNLLLYPPHQYLEFVDPEPIYDLSYGLSILLETLVDVSILQRHLRHLAPVSAAISTVIFGFTTFIFPRVALWTKADIVWSLWSIASSILLFLLNIFVLDSPQHRARQLNAQLEAQVASINSELTRKDQLLADYCSTLERKDEEVIKAKKDLEHAEEAKNAESDRVSECNKQIATLRSDLSTSTEKANDLEAAKATAETQARVATEKHVSASAEASASLKEKDSTISSLEDSRKSLSRRLGEAEVDQRCIANMLKDKSADMKALGRVNEHLEQQVQDLKSRDQRVVSLLTDSDLLVEEFRTQLATERARVSHLETTTRENAEQMKSVEEERATAAEALSSLRRDLALAQTVASELRGVEGSVLLLKAERDELLAYKEQAEREKVASRAEAEKAATQLGDQEKLIEDLREVHGKSMRQLSTQHDERLKSQTEEHAKTLDNLVRTHRGAVQQLTEEVDAKSRALEELQRSVFEYGRKDLVSNKPLSPASPPVTPLSTRIIGLPQSLEGAPSVVTADTNLTAPAFPAVELTTAAFDDIAMAPPQGTSEFAPSANNPVLDIHLEKEPTSSGEALATPASETTFNVPVSFNFAIPVSDISDMAGRSTMVNQPFADFSLVSGPGFKKGSRGTRFVERGRRNQPTESARHFNSVPVPRIVALGTPVPEANAQVSSRNSELSASGELPSVGSVSASELIIPTVRVKGNILMVDRTHLAPAPEQQILEVPRTPVIATGYPWGLPKLDDAWADNGSLASPVSGVLANGPQPHPQPAARKFRALPQKSTGERLHRQSAGQPAIHTLPPSTPTSALASPSHVPSSNGTVNPQDLMISAPMIRAGPTGSNLRPHRPLPRSLHSRGTLQPPSLNLETSTQPVASTSAPSAQIGESMRMQEETPEGRDALIESLVQWAHGVSNHNGGNEGNGGDDDHRSHGQGGEEEVEEQEETTRRW